MICGLADRQCRKPGRITPHAPVNAVTFGSVTQSNAGSANTERPVKKDEGTLSVETPENVKPVAGPPAYALPANEACPVTWPVPPISSRTTSNETASALVPVSDSETRTARRRLRMEFPQSNARALNAVRESSTLRGENNSTDSKPMGAKTRALLPTEPTI